MDDYLGSFNSSEEARSTSRQLHKIKGNVGFHLTKWSSNNAELVQIFPLSKLLRNKVNLGLIEPTVERILEVLWNSKQKVL